MEDDLIAEEDFDFLDEDIDDLNLDD